MIPAWLNQSGTNVQQLLDFERLGLSAGFEYEGTLPNQTLRLRCLRKTPRRT